MPFCLCVNSFAALMMAYDLWTRRSLHRATIWGDTHDRLALGCSSFGPNGSDGPHNRLVAGNVTGKEISMHLRRKITYAQNQLAVRRVLTNLAAQRLS
jgi:hypothetical protein